MKFSDLIGNEKIKKDLEKALHNKKFANTLLFSGPNGIGKSLFAKVASKDLLYPDYCPTSCEHRIDREQHPDLHVYFPEGKTQMHSISSMKKLIQEVYMESFEAKAKVFIIHDAEKMLPSSANALLKTLEEPTVNSYLFLISSKPLELLSTITSRCMHFRFSYIAEHEITQLIEKKYQKTAIQAKQIAREAQGSIRKAIEIATFPNYEKIREMIFSFLNKKPIQSYTDFQDSMKELEKTFASFYEKTPDLLKEKLIDVIFSHIMMWYRDLHLLNAECDESLLFYADFSQELKTHQKEYLPSMDQVHLILDEVRFGLDRNFSLVSCLERLFFRLELI